MKLLKIRCMPLPVIVVPVLITLGFAIGAQSQETFKFASGKAKYDSAWVGGKRNIASNTVNGTFHAGQSWDQVWTRDGSYSIQLAAGIIDPVTSRSTFNNTTETWNSKTIQLQDACGDFGGWPVLSDGIVWATAAWEFYCQTGDQTFLGYAYPIVRNSLQRGEQEVLDATDGLFKGCASFMESNSAYPGAYAFNGSMVGATKAGSTNMLYYHAYVVADSMAKLLGKSQATLDTLTQKATALKTAINKILWNSSKGYYYYIKQADGTFQDNNEGLMDAFSIMYDVADSAKRVSIFSKVVPSAWGIVCQYPEYPEWSDYNKDFTCYYHSNKVWPFVQGYWAWAASKYKNTNIFMNELDKLARLWAESDPGEFREYYFTEQGSPAGGGQQLWSACGYLSMVFHGLFGMNFLVNGLYFDPVVPDTFKTAMTMTNFTYRGMTLNITVTGPGSYVQSFLLDNVSQSTPFVPGTLTGMHSVVITLSKTVPSSIENATHASTVLYRKIKTSYNSQQEVIFDFGTAQEVHATVYDIAGRSSGELVGANGSVTVSRTGCRPGSYFVKWRSTDGSGIQKIVLR
jgi:hypothetical protein